MHNRPKEQDRFEELRPSFNKWLCIFAFALGVCVLCIGATYGKEPYVLVEIRGRTVIAIVSGISLIGCVFTGGMLLYAWLLDRYTDTEHSRDSTDM